MEYVPSGFRGDPGVDHTPMDTIAMVTAAANIAHMVLMLPATSWVPMSEAWPMLPGGTRLHEFEAIVQHQQWRARPRWRRRRRRTARTAPTGGRTLGTATSGGTS